MGTLSALVSSVLDHARTGFEGAWLWYAVAIGVFGTVVPVAYAALDRPSRIDSFTYIAAMLFLIATVVLGSFLHVRSDLVLERFLRGARPLAPLLFSNLGMLGLIALLDPELLQTIKQPQDGPESGNGWKTYPES